MPATDVWMQVRERDVEQQLAGQTGVMSVFRVPATFTFGPMPPELLESIARIFQSAHMRPWARPLWDEASGMYVDFVQGWGLPDSLASSVASHSHMPTSLDVIRKERAETYSLSRVRALYTDLVQVERYFALKAFSKWSLWWSVEGLSDSVQDIICLVKTLVTNCRKSDEDFDVEVVTELELARKLVAQGGLCAYTQTLMVCEQQLQPRRPSPVSWAFPSWDQAILTSPY
jgi:hypothetical protein